MQHAVSDMRVLVLGNLEPHRLARIQKVDSSVVLDGGSADAPPRAVFIWEQRPPMVSALLAAHSASIEWAQFRRVGVPPPVLQLFDQHPRIVLTNGSGAAGVAVAEHVMTVLLALLKRLPELQQLQQRREWPWFTNAELQGSTALILGLGDLGRAIARVLRPFGAHVIGVRRAAEPVPEVDRTLPVSALHEALPAANILIIAASLTADTRGLIGAPELALLPRGSYVVNVARGGLLDEAALIAALQSGHLAGAALDVFEREPLPPESPLWSMPNVIVTPHAAAHTEATDDRAVDLFAANLRRFLDGEPLVNRLEP
jgi:phosphoglycerate dehydrogenase-like enzyme